MKLSGFRFLEQFSQSPDGCLLFPFTGLSTDLMFTATGGSTNAEDVSPVIAELSNFETPLLDWLGDPAVMAKNILHEFLEEELRPNYITTSTAINSATAATGAQLADFGDLLTVGTLLENESVAPEIMQVSSVVGQSSVLFTRAFGGGAVGSLAAGQQLFVRGAYQLEGGGGSGDVTRRRRRRQTYVGFFQVPISVSDTQNVVATLGQMSDVAAIAVAGTTNEYDRQKMLRIIEAVRDLEKEVIRGIQSNSIGSRTTYRTFNGLRTLCGSINSTVTNSSFDANPHKYIGDVWEQAFVNGASETEDWGMLVGRTWFRSISNLNDTKVQDSNASEEFKRKITTYQGPFGRCNVMLSRWMPAQAAIIIPRNRVKVVPLNGRALQHVQYAKTKSAVDGVIEGEYTVEIHHPQAIPQVHS